MGKVKLTYRFHNPNPSDETAEYLEKIFKETSKVKLENMLKNSIRKELIRSCQKLIN